MAKTGLTKIQLQYRKPLRLSLVKKLKENKYPKYARDSEIT